MLALLRRRSFLVLWAGHNVSILGDYLFFIAMTYWVFARTGSTAATGALLITSTLPGIVCAPLAGRIADRWERRRVMLVAEVARAMLFVAFLGAITREPLALWPIYAVGFCQTALAVCFWTARSAFMPQIVGEDTLLAANAVYTLSDGAVRIIAPTLSAAALLEMGVPGVALLDVASLAISATCISRMRTPGSAAVAVIAHAHGTCQEDTQTPPSAPDPTALRNPASGTTGTPSVPTEPTTAEPARARAGAASDRRSIVLIGLGGLVAGTAGALSILLPALLRSTLGLGPLAFGWMLTAQAAGEVAVGGLLGRKRRHAEGAHAVLAVAASCVFGGAALALMTQMRMLPLLLAASFVFGGMTAAIALRLVTLVQSGTPPFLLGRRLARFTGVQALAQVGGMLVAGIASARTGTVRMMVLCGMLYLLGGPLALALTRSLRGPYNLAQEEVESE